MIDKLLIEHHLVFLSLKGGCRGSSESTHVKIPHCWKLHALAQLFNMNKGTQRDDHQTKTETKNYITKLDCFTAPSYEQYLYTRSVKQSITKPAQNTVMVATLVFCTRVASITTPRPLGPLVIVISWVVRLYVEIIHEL